MKNTEIDCKYKKQKKLFFSSNNSIFVQPIFKFEIKDNWMKKLI